MATSREGRLVEVWQGLLVARHGNAAQAGGILDIALRWGMGADEKGRLRWLTKQILRPRAEGVSQPGIANVLGCSRNTVAAVFTAAANAAGIGFGEVAAAADEVRRLLLPEVTKPESERVSPDLACAPRIGNSATR